MPSASHLRAALKRAGHHYIAAVLACAWIIDYLRQVRRIRLHFGDRSRTLGRQANELAQSRIVSICARCPALSKIYWPTWYAPHACLQLFLLGAKEFRARFLQRSPYVREMCRLRDGAVIALDWVLPCTQRAEDKHLPVVVLLHGAFQDSQSVTMSGLGRQLAARGMPAVVMNRRGYGNLTLNNEMPRLDLFGLDEDLDDVLELVARRQPGRLVAIVGFSCGTALSGRFAGKRPFLSAWESPAAKVGQAPTTWMPHTTNAEGKVLPRLLCTVAYDPGYDVGGAVCKVRWPYTWGLNFALKYFYAFRHRAVLRNRSSSFNNLVKDMLNPRSGAANTFRLSRKLQGGFKEKGSQGWLQDNEVKLLDIEVPSLLINSRDDPIARWENVEAYFNQIKENPNLVLAELQRGSHGCKFDFSGLNNVAQEMICQFVMGSQNELPDFAFPSGGAV